MYGKYEEEEDFEKLYTIPAGRSDPFTDDVRLPIFLRMLDEPTEVGGLELRIKKCIYYGQILAAFPLHESAKLDRIYDQWFQCSLPWDMPYDLIKEYFGVKISLYYKFIGQFNTE